MLIRRIKTPANKQIRDAILLTKQPKSSNDSESYTDIASQWNVTVHENSRSMRDWTKFMNRRKRRKTDRERRRKRDQQRWSGNWETSRTLERNDESDRIEILFRTNCELSYLPFLGFLIGDLRKSQGVVDDSSLEKSRVALNRFAKQSGHSAPRSELDSKIGPFEAQIMKLRCLYRVGVCLYAVSIYHHSHLYVESLTEGLLYMQLSK